MWVGSTQWIEGLKNKRWRKKDFAPFFLPHRWSWDISSHLLLPADWGSHPQLSGSQASTHGLSHNSDDFPVSPACRWWIVGILSLHISVCMCMCVRVSWCFCFSGESCLIRQVRLVYLCTTGNTCQMCCVPGPVLNTSRIRALILTMTL